MYILLIFSAPLIMKRFALGLGTALVALSPTFASAHEHQIFEIGDKTYDFTVGSLNEPIVVDDKTGVEFSVWTTGSGAAAVTGLEDTLKVEIAADGKTKVMDLAPAWGEEGSYHAVFYPTIATTYSYRFFGTVNNIPVDLTFTCNAGGHNMAAMEKNTTHVEVSEGVTRIEQRGAFSCPLAKAAMGFPAASSSVDSLATYAGFTSSISIAALAIALFALIRTRKRA